MAGQVEAGQASGAVPLCLFLSHSGADTEAARELKRRILESPQAGKSGLTVWFDKDDPRLAGADRGRYHQKGNRLCGLCRVQGRHELGRARGRLGLARATGDGAIPFIPILAQSMTYDNVASLPPFVQQHQGVTDPLNNLAELTKLITAILARSSDAPARLTDEPFVGLPAMTEREADRFFGREAEVEELVDDLRRNRLVAIVADSGAGKSSLAMAGLAPAFRGGALADPARREPDQYIWHVVIMRPGADPLEGLRRGVTEAAEHMGLPPDARAGLRRRLTLDDANESAYALRCDLPAATVETLLIVDGFTDVTYMTSWDDMG
jgi:hypothetical protein